MTIDLADMLQRRADRVDVPHPPSADVLTAGRRLRRRRRAGAGAATVGAVALAVVGALVLGPALRGGPQELEDLAAAQPAPTTWAVAAGSEVALSTGAKARVPGTVKSIYYTSAGVLARTGASATTDAVDSGYSLVEDDGSLSSFTLELGDRVPSTDPTLPYLAYATATADPEAWEVVLRDVRDGDVVRRVPVTGSFTWGGWVAPPVSLSGDHVYVGLDDATIDVAWRTGEVRGSTVIPGSALPSIAAGRVVTGDDTGQPEATWTVRDAQSGATVATGRLGGAASASLAPDGRHVVLVPWQTCTGSTPQCSFDQRSSTVIDLASGDRRRIDIADALGWTSTGDLLLVVGDRIERCDADSGRCVDADTPVPVGELRLGGSSYEA